MSSGAGARLNELLEEADLTPVDEATATRFEAYYSLIIRWNARINLTAVRDEEGILARHFVESIACARMLPVGIGTLLDFGSGAGLPGIPIALCRPEIAVTLAESQGKKAAFLQEAIRVLALPVRVHAGRAETLGSLFDCVILRAVDRMASAVQAAAGLIAPAGWLGILTTRLELNGLIAAAGSSLALFDTAPLPGSRDRLMALIKSSISRK